MILSFWLFFEIIWLKNQCLPKNYFGFWLLGFWIWFQLMQRKDHLLYLYKCKHFEIIQNIYVSKINSSSIYNFHAFFLQWGGRSYHVLDYGCPTNAFVKSIQNLLTDCADWPEIGWEILSCVYESWWKLRLTKSCLIIKLF